MKTIFKRIFKFFTGHKLGYTLFEKFYFMGVIGMNHGNGGNPDSSGELAAIRYVRQKIQEPNPVIFDVGANFGKYTLLLHREIPGARIFSFEPSANYFEKLSAATAHTGANAIHLGLGTKNETLTLYKYTDHPGLASVFSRQLQHLQVAVESTESIKIVRLDEFCAENEIPMIHFLKLDIEGNEFFALQGTGHLLSEGKIRFIQFEFGGTNIDSKTYFRDFWQLLHPNYRIFKILKNGLAEVTYYNEFREIFANTNYLAEWRRK